MERIFPFSVTGSGSIFSPITWFWVAAVTLGNAVVLGTYTAAVLIVYNTVMR